MNTLPSRLVRLAERGPSTDPAIAVRRAILQAAGEVEPDPADSPAARAWRLAGAAALVAAVVGAVVLLSTRGRESGLPTADAPAVGSVPESFETSFATDATWLSDPHPSLAPTTDTALTDGSLPSAHSTPTADTAPESSLPDGDPVGSLPELPDVVDPPPPTIVGTAPQEWYRLAPDLDVAWFSRNDGTSSQVCWRTAADSVCLDDTAGPGELVFVARAPSRHIAVFIESRNGHRPGEAVVRFADGSAGRVAVTWDDTLGWGVARFSAGAHEVVSAELAG